MLANTIQVAPPHHRHFSKNLHDEYHPVILQYLWNRGITSGKAVDCFIQREIPYDPNPFLMKDMDKAVERLWKAVDTGEKIVVFGDYDADGVTATALLTGFLSRLNANVVWYIPSRDDGYGMSVAAVNELLDDHPDTALIVTVDNGIKAAVAVDYAVAISVDVIVTDHHVVGVDPAEFPSNAYAVVNPQQQDCDYPEAMICGCAVAYKLAHAMVLSAGDRDIFALTGSYAPHDDFIDLVAIGTVADVMPMISYENRNIVWRGLQSMMNDPRPGIKALFDNDQYIDTNNLTAETIGFSIAPLINAASRVDHPRWAMYLLQADNEAEANRWALKAYELNAIRKNMQEEVVEEVDLTMSTLLPEDIDAMSVIVNKLEACPHGIIGLVAGDLSRKYNRPAIVMSKTETMVDGQRLWAASARSIDGFNIAECLNECSSLLYTHGGHAMSAGFRIQENNIQDFESRVISVATKSIGAVVSKQHVADIEIELHELDEVLHDIILSMEPLAGLSCPQPLFVTRNLHVISCSAFSSGKHLKMLVSDGRGNSCNAIGWRMGDLEEVIGDTCDLLYRVGRENFAGRKGIRLQIEAIANKTE